MEQIRTYILSVTAAAIFCALVSALGGKGTSLSGLLKLMTGVVMAAVVIRPMAEMSSVNLNRYLDTLNADAMTAVEAGTAYSKDQISARITRELESYILDKAAELSLDIAVELTLDGETMVPVSIIIDGSASPYAKTALGSILRDDLGIPTEAQTWK